MTKPAPNTLFTCFSDVDDKDTDLVTMRVSAFPNALDCASGLSPKKLTAPVLYDFVHPDGRYEPDLDLFRSCRMSVKARRRLMVAYLEVQRAASSFSNWACPDMEPMIQALDVDRRKQRKKK
jgi:hypothetical protein